jgi:lysophospholipase L1-like esterase
MRKIAGTCSLRPLACFALVILAVGRVTIAETPATRPAKIQIVLAGDSTVTDTAGWGVGFKNCLSEEIECTNVSIGGRSSGSFLREGRWQKVLEMKPDYVLVQFGHNDEPGHGTTRQSDPQTTYKRNMQHYVDDARAAGIRIVLVTSLSRREWGDDGKIHSKLVPYVEVVKQIAAEDRVPLIDLHAKSIELYEKIGKGGTDEISPPKGKGLDGTHLNSKGSVVIGRIVADELKAVVPDLEPYIH